MERNLLHCFLAQNLHAGSAQIDDLVVNHHHVQGGCRAQILEVRSQLGARPGVDARVGALPGRLLEGLANNELEAAVLERRDAREITAHVSCRRKPQSVECLLRAFNVERRPPFSANRLVCHSGVWRSRGWMEEAVDPLICSIPERHVNCA